MASLAVVAYRPTVLLEQVIPHIVPRPVGLATPLNERVVKLTARFLVSQVFAVFASKTPPWSCFADSKIG